MRNDHTFPETIVRTRLHVRGQVQGVGFRPFVHSLATDMMISGWVRNSGDGVEIEVQTSCSQLALFLHRLNADAPSSAHIKEIKKSSVPLHDAEQSFTIRTSINSATTTSISPDSAICVDCVSELFDPANRRYRYPFTHCVRCGPRYTITARLPYDRLNTSMSAFSECADCRAEREQPTQRRFHAQTNACPVCGPRIWLSDATEQKLATADAALAIASSHLTRGDIVAIKGLGGFHLACDARNPEAVRSLRERKMRKEKPFAVMFANVVSASEFVEVSREAAALLESPQRPIVLLPKRRSCNSLLSDVAPELLRLGVMLPYTPIQYLLFHEAANQPSGIRWLNEMQPTVLIMTSANVHGEPLLTNNQQALSQLGSVADVFLMHDREILIRCDDSVVFPNSGERPQQFLRRARGYVPAPIALNVPGAPGLAVGAYLHSTVCVAHKAEAFVSEHIGNLDSRPSCVAFDVSVNHLLDLLEVSPAWIAADLHPDFYSTQFAQALAAKNHLPLINVQHHHAHIGAVMAEHQLVNPAIGVVLDGFGLGSDGAIWGGELLSVDGARFERLGHLHTLPLPGGERVIYEPWRMAASALYELGQRDEILKRFGSSSHMLMTMIEKGLNTPRSSSAGRLFDATAGLLGIKSTTSYQGQAAAILEALATSFGEVEPMKCGYHINGDTLNMMPLLAQLTHMPDVAHAAALFHATVAEALADWVLRHATKKGIRDVIFGGGCFVNRLLSQTLRTKLEAQSLQIFEAVTVPPGDGGLSLGQAWVALRQLQS